MNRPNYNACVCSGQIRGQSGVIPNHLLHLSPFPPKKEKRLSTVDTASKYQNVIMSNKPM